MTIAYYFGAFIILLAYTFFVGLQWENLGRGGLAVAAWAGSRFWLIGRSSGTEATARGQSADLRGDGSDAARRLHRAAARRPLAGLGRGRGLPRLLPDDRRHLGDPGGDLHRRRPGRRLVTRFPLLTLLIGFWGWYLSMDLTEAVTGHDDFAWGPAEWCAGRQRAGDAGDRLWLQRGATGGTGASGSTSSATSPYSAPGALALDDGPALGLLFLAIYLGGVVASVWLQSRVFLVFGALGCYSYVS